MNAIPAVRSLAAAVLVTLALSGGASAGPLHDAALHGDVAAVQELLDGGADVNALDEHGRTPLLMAMSWMEVEVAAVKVLLDAGADVNAKADEGVTPLKIAQWNMSQTVELKRAPWQEVIKLLKAHGARIARADTLHDAALFGDVAAIKVLLADGAKVNARDEHGGTPLHYAVDLGHVPTIKDSRQNKLFIMANSMLYFRPWTIP